MPKSNLINEMRAKAEERAGKRQAEEVTRTETASLIPPAPDLPEMLGPEGKESWDRDWLRITLAVQHGLSLFEHFNTLLDAHRREERTPEPEAATDPRVRAQQLIEVLKRYQERYQPILSARTHWQQHLEGLRRFNLTAVPAIAAQGLRTALSEAMLRLHRPLNDLSSLPPLPAPPAPDDERGFEAALNLVRQVKATLTEHANAPALFAQSLFGVRQPSHWQHRQPDRRASGRPRIQRRP